MVTIGLNFSERVTFAGYLPVTFLYTLAYLVDLRSSHFACAYIWREFDSELGKTVALLQKIADNNFSKTVVFETRVALSTSVALICFV